MLVCVAGVLSGCRRTDEPWRFRWEERTDRDGKPAGVYEVTPCPITEKTLNYTIGTDEGPTTYELGELYFVDGAMPDDGGDGRSLGTAKRTIAAAIEAAGKGHRTLIVRGAHDGFDGVYHETFRALPGVDDTHRWMVVGYGQERPILDADSGRVDMIRSTGEPEAFVTIQRLKLRNSQRNGVRLGRLDRKIDGHFNLVDVWMDHCINVPKGADAGVYYLNADHGFIRHCTVTHSKGHGFKIGDGASDFIIEWSVADGTGWYPEWDGPGEYFGTHPTALDFPNDVNNAFRVTCRYCIARNSLFYAVQVRRVRDFRFHHNEISGSPHFDDVRDCDNHSVGRHQVILFAGHTSGEFHSNIIHTPTSSGTTAIYVSACTDDAPVINIHDNIIYGNHKRAISVQPSNKDLQVNIVGNRIFSHGPDVRELIFSGIGNRLVLTGNVLCTDAAGRCLDIDTGQHVRNRYFFPKGTRGVELGPDESDADPGWTPLPTGPLGPEMFRRDNTVLKGK